MRRVGRLVLDRTVDNFFAETEQVAFCTQNVVPGIDFTNDPLLQGRNFSYLDTQLKRLGSPNFTHLPVNAPKCPVAHFQQDGHMAMTNPVGRVNYEPNSWSDGGPREDPVGGFQTFPAPEDGREAARPLGALRRPLQPGSPVLDQPDARRAAAHRQRRSSSSCRSASSRASGPGWWPTCATSTTTSRCGSPTGSGCLRCRIRRRRVLAPITDLPPSPALSIVANGPETLRRAQDRRAHHRRHRRRPCSRRCARRPRPRARSSSWSPRRSAAPMLSDGTLLPAHQKIDGGPSVLYDAVAILASSEGAALAGQATRTARDFVTDAHAHAKYVAYHPDAVGAAGGGRRVGTGRRRLRRARAAGPPRSRSSSVPQPAATGPARRRSTRRGRR